jgi:hypothetical protein
MYKFWHSNCFSVVSHLFTATETKMDQQLISVEEKKIQHSTLLIGTGLMVASMILVPAIAVRIGLGASITGALRIALMKASSCAIREA